MLRLRNVSQKNVLKVVKEMDAFPKVPESYQEKSATSGGLSVITFIIMGVLVLSEVSYYSATDLKFKYEVDTNYSGTVTFNLDMTVAMKCRHIGADVLDQTGEQVFGVNQMSLENVYWDLTPNQRDYQNLIQEVNGYLSNDYHAIHEVIWKEGKSTRHQGMPKREGPAPDHPHDACRVHGNIELKKIAGNFHIIAGKSIPVIPSGHAHLSMNMETRDHNYSHRIDHLSFGESVAGVVYPLDGSEVTTDQNFHSFQYFMKIVPTLVRTYRANMDTYQFAVTEKNRAINHAAGSHGNPGIFMKYDLTPMVIRVTETHKPYWQFLVRLCGIVGGIYSVSGIINTLLSYIVECVCCRMKKKQKYEDAVTALPAQSFPPASPLLPPPSPTDQTPPQSPSPSLSPSLVPSTDNPTVALLPNNQ